MKLLTTPYLVQQNNWPRTGKHILASYDDASIVVYQAYRPVVGRFAATHGYFGGEYSLSRMSWIKSNFLWMMFRSGWGSKLNQEVTLAVRLKRSAFDTILWQALHSSYSEELYHDIPSWKHALEHSTVRLQWDPDHDPTGAKLQRRALQLGLSGPELKRYAREWILDIEDISPFVQEQYQHVLSRNFESLVTPQERVYEVDDELAKKLGMHLGN